MVKFQILFILSLTYLTTSCSEEIQLENPAEKQLREISKPPQQAEINESPKEPEEKSTLKFVTKKYTNLSNKFSFSVKLKLVYYGETPFFYTEWTEVKILDKMDSLIQTLRNIPTWDSNIDLNEVRSFETKFRHKKGSSEGYYGKIVVADFNLDSLFDFALIENVPMTSGTPSYYFYLQKPDGTFSKSKYLTENVHYIPETVNAEKRSFVTHGWSGCCVHRWRYYKIDSLGNFRKVKTVEKDARVD